MRAISGVVVTALLIAVAIVAVIMLFANTLPILKTGTPLVVSAQKLSVNYIKSNQKQYQVATIDLRIESKTDKQLTIKQLVIQYIDTSGNVGTVTVKYETNSGNSGWQVESQAGNLGGNLEVKVQGSAVLNPGQTQHLMVVLKQDVSQSHLRQVTFQVVAEDPAGNEYTATSNTVDIT